MKKLVLFYLYTFLVLDMIMGLLLVSLRLESVLIINPGQLVRTTLLVLLFVVLLKDAFKRLNNMNSRVLMAMVYFGIVVCIVFLKHNSWGAELNNASKLIFILLLVYYINKHKHYYLTRFDKIMLVNFCVLTVNLFFAYITGLGIATYGDTMNATKGFIYSGNAVSIISLVFMAYYIFKVKTDAKAKYLCVIALANIYIVGTKAIFIVPVIILIYLFTKIRWTPAKVIVSTSIMVPIIVAGIIFIAPFITQVYQSRYVNMLEKTGFSFASEGNASVGVEQAILAYRRIDFASEQISYQINDPIGLIFGYGESGQYNFWTDRGQAFTFAAMDFFDFFFEYGIVGSLLFYSFIFYPFYLVVSRWEFTPLAISFIFIFLYSFFGGYVIYNTTANTMFSLLIALNLPRQKLI